MASTKAGRISSYLHDVVDLHESNEIIQYSPTLRDQIPRSYAANAYNVFQDAMQRYEIVRICAFWDFPSLDNYSLLTVDALLDHSEIPDLVSARAKSDWLQIDIELVGQDKLAPADKQAADEALAIMRERDATTEANNARSVLQEALAELREIAKSETLRSVKNARNKYLAHTLESTREERRSVVAPMNHGDEGALLDRTLRIAGKLQLAIAGGNVEWEDVRRIARREAQALWGSCRFAITD